LALRVTRLRSKPKPEVFVLRLVTMTQQSEQIEGFGLLPAALTSSVFLLLSTHRTVDAGREVIGWSPPTPRSLQISIISDIRDDKQQTGLAAPFDP